MQNSPKPLDRFAVVGEEAALELALQTICTRGLPNADKVKVSVAGPGIPDVPHTVSELKHEGPWNNSVVVTFTPERVGPYTITAVFEPNGGTATYVLQAITKRVGATERVIAWDGPIDCVGFTFTSKGTLSCMHHTIESPTSSKLGNEVVTQRGQRLTGDAFVSQGDVLWRISQESGMRVLERRVADGTSFAVTHQALNATAAGPMALIDEDAWLVGSATTLLRAHPESDGTISVTSIPRPGVGARALGGEARGLMIWSAENPQRPELGFVTPGGVGEIHPMFGAEFGYRVAGIDGEVLWADRQYWTKEDAISRRTLAAFSAAGTLHAPVVEVQAESASFATIRDADPAFGFFPPRISIRSDPQLGNRPPGQPFAVPKLEAGAITLEFFDVGPGYEQLTSATRTHAFAIAQDGKSVKVIDR